METFILGYTICVIYCIYRIYRRSKKSTQGSIVEDTPALDTLAIVLLAPILAPADIIATLYQKFKK